jgi:hypothetical protein
VGRPFIDRQHNKILVECERSCDEPMPARKARNNGLEIILTRRGPEGAGALCPRVM